eukprot:3524394-Pyramimonas_sp.AAC.1
MGSMPSRARVLDGSLAQAVRPFIGAGVDRPSMVARAVKGASAAPRRHRLSRGGGKGMIPTQS